MADRAQYNPGPAFGAQIRKDGEENWTLIVVRELRHSPEKVWQAITDPTHLREWAPFDADASLWTNINRRYIAMGAAGWHICFDVLDHLLSGTPIGCTVGPDAMKIGDFQRLHAEYAHQFGIKSPNAPKL